MKKLPLQLFTRRREIKSHFPLPSTPVRDVEMIADATKAKLLNLRLYGSNAEQSTFNLLPDTPIQTGRPSLFASPDKCKPAPSICSFLLAQDWLAHKVENFLLLAADIGPTISISVKRALQKII